MNTYYKPGCWNVICFVCGKQVKSDEILKRWDGALVCKSDYEPRHSLDLIRTRSEETSVPYSNSEPTDVSIYICYLEQSQGIADLGTADCARADITLSMEF